MEFADKNVWLKSSPMYQMSLGSRELFHSNFLAWLFEQHPNAISILGLSAPSGLTVHREQKHIDLTIRHNTRTIAVIENKVKDVPNLSQLLSYSCKTKDAENHILLTMVEPSFDAAPWIVVTYAELADRLHSWLDQDHRSQLSTRDKAFITEYACMVREISALLGAWSSERGGAFWFDQPDMSVLKDIRFEDTANKLLASTFAGVIKDCLASQKLFGSAQKAGLNLKVAAEFFNKTPVMTACLHHHSHGVKLEIQIQGNQYRRMITCGKFNIPKKGQPEFKERSELLRRIEKRYSLKNWLFHVADEGEGRKKAFEVPEWLHREGGFATGMMPEFGSYAPGGIYQYVNIAKTPECDVSLGYSHLRDCVTSDIKRGISLLSDQVFMGSFSG